jgi:hypothetical protein
VNYNARKAAFMATVLKTPQDWLVGVRYVDWKGEEKSRVIGISRHVLTAELAKTEALNSLRRTGLHTWELPPTIKAVEARRAEDIGITSMHGRKAQFLAKVKL